MRHLILNIILGMFTICTPALAQSAEYTHLHQGNRAFQRGEWAKAEQYYRQALEINPRNARALFNLGDAYLAQKNGKDALDCFVKAAKGESNPVIKAAAYHNIGFIHHNNHDYDKAIQAYKEALRNNPHDEDTRYNLVLAQKQRQQQPQQEEQQEQQQDSPQQQQQQMAQDNVQQLLQHVKQTEQQTRQKMEQLQQPRRKQLQKGW